MPRIVIVADAHLGAAPPADQAALLDFLDAVPRLGEMMLLGGDIFDYWFSYKRLIPRRNFRVAAALSHLTRTVPVLMVGGNHDRWGDSFWDRDAGVRFAPHELQFTAGDRSLLAIHGDGLHEERPGASWMHSITSSRAVIGIYRALHPDFGFWLADKMGHNLDFGEARAEAVAAAAARQLTWATRRLRDDPSLHALIMGHTHREAAHEIEPGRWYVNPGAWLDGHRYAILDDSGATLHRFS